MDAMEQWVESEGMGPSFVVVDGVEITKGSRVRLKPRPGGDIVDLALAGRTAIVEGIDQDLEDNLHVAVIVEDDPGRDLGDDRQPGHRFFFAPDELEPVHGDRLRPEHPRVLVAGVGNVFLGDDGFGVAVANRLLGRELPAEVKVVDFGIRGFDLAYALQEPYEVAILVDTTPRGGPPGTIYVIEVEIAEPAEVSLDTHGMDPVKVLALARSLGRVPDRTYVIGCEPQTVPAGETYDDMVFELSEPVLAAVDDAIREVESLISDILSQNPTDPGGASA